MLYISQSDPLVCSNSELTSDTMNPFRHFGMTPWMMDWSVARHLPSWDSITQKNTDLHSCLEWDFNPWSKCLSRTRAYVS